MLQRAQATFVQRPAAAKSSQSSAGINVNIYSRIKTSLLGFHFLTFRFVVLDVTVRTHLQINGSDSDPYSKTH